MYITRDMQRQLTTIERFIKRSYIRMRICARVGVVTYKVLQTVFTKIAKIDSTIEVFR